ncbi:uncharacterized protein EI97DRAFT_432814 [Westerdykella ornata]|uniref:Uncharacterized protein n=1 Tax=Westerdykella ornata TaxID=318751 RepID=A0A6A6JNI4_WESOR|nr:uncharacterized protein EI97DRAFT_432814 [Westerdykella ornata]KAF2277216.1 hypothetical protein EI97DRAFT_432814 [Westerdykella ornata]
MAPLDPDVTGHSNALPLAVFSSQILAVAGLSTHILLSIYRTAKFLPPSAATRAQQSTRRRHAALFFSLGAVALASVTTFAIAWRILSYFEWADHKGDAREVPGSLWTGWYGTGEKGVGRWRLGDWWSDVDDISKADAVVLAAPESFFYLYEHFTGVTAAAIFFGVEGRRRNLPISTIASFVLLSAMGSLGWALNLFFVLLLYTPMAVHDDGSVRHDTHFAPHPAVLYVPVIGAIALEQSLPMLLARRTDLTLFRIAYVTVPLFLAFAPEIIPLNWGRLHATKAAAHHSYAPAFHTLGLSSLVLHWAQFLAALLVNTPPPRSSVYDVFHRAIGVPGEAETPSSRLRAGLANTFDKLKLVSGHPAVSVTGMDVLVTGATLLAWAFVRRVDVGDVLECSVLRFLSGRGGRKGRHVAFKEKEEVVEGGEGEGREGLKKTKEKGGELDGSAKTSMSTPPRRGRGRPRKGTVTTTSPKGTEAAPSALAHSLTTGSAPASTSSAPSPGSTPLRRSTRRRTRTRANPTDALHRAVESSPSSHSSSDEAEGEDGDGTYEPPARLSSALEQTEFEGSSSRSGFGGEEELIEGGEATALALVLAFLGGLGQVGAGVLGAEVIGGW